MRYLEDFAVGQKFGSGKLKVEAERVKSFASEFDPQPFHLDDTAARGSQGPRFGLKRGFATGIV